MIVVNTFLANALIAVMCIAYIALFALLIVIIYKTIKE